MDEFKNVWNVFLKTGLILLCPQTCVQNLLRFEDILLCLRFDLGWKNLVGKVVTELAYNIFLVVINVFGLVMFVV